MICLSKLLPEQPLFPIGVVNHLALCIQKHGRARLQCVSGPVRDFIVGGVARARESGPSTAHIARRLEPLLALAADALWVVELESNLQRVRGFGGISDSLRCGR